MANKSLTDLTARTATADSDLIHVNSGGTDYKETKADFLQGAIHTAFEVTSTLTSQIDALSPGTYIGFINSNNYQTATGVPENASFYVLCYKYSATAGICYVTSYSDNNTVYFKKLFAGTWDSAWTKMPTRAEITSLNSNLSNSKLHYKEHYFSNVTLPASTLYVNLGDIHTNFGIPSGSYYVSFFIRGWSGTGTSVISLAVASNSADLYLMGSQAFTGGAFTVRCWYVATN